uniref:Uncharacterized protein n=1 Tax=Tenebrio molitor TaxID=7067 RepID=A0A8J6H6F9_TENMO|nr:hypothetical protein GEV33_014619 [Tenebrio molitor]
MGWSLVKGPDKGHGTRVLSDLRRGQSPSRPLPPLRFRSRKMLMVDFRTAAMSKDDFSWTIDQFLDGLRNPCGRFSVGQKSSGLRSDGSSGVFPNGSGRLHTGDKINRNLDRGHGPGISALGWG